MPVYTVLTPLRHNGRVYKVGEPVEMPHDQARRLRDNGTLGLATPTATPVDVAPPPPAKKPKPATAAKG